MKINFSILFNHYFDISNFLFHPAPQGQCQGQDLHSLHDHTPCTPSITPKIIGCDATINNKNFPFGHERNKHMQCRIFIFSRLLSKCILNEIPFSRLKGDVTGRCRFCFKLLGIVQVKCHKDG